MSGGSYNYLCDATLLDREYDVRRMADRLQEMSHRHVAIAKAARKTQLLVYLMELVQEAGDDLHNVWHAVEWRDSNDWGDDQMVEAIEVWADERYGTGRKQDK
jgi:hypothetical protein